MTEATEDQIRQWLKISLKNLEEAKRIFKDDVGVKYFYSNTKGDIENRGDEAWLQFPKSHEVLWFKPSTIREILITIDEHKKLLAIAKLRQSDLFEAIKQSDMTLVAKDLILVVLTEFGKSIQPMREHPKVRRIK